MQKRVSVIGLGYMGLPTAIILAESDFQVFGYDIDEKKVEFIKNGKSVINEPDLISRLKFVLENKSFSVSTKLKQADYYLISVPTPLKIQPMVSGEIELADESLAYSFDPALDYAKTYTCSSSRSSRVPNVSEVYRGTTNKQDRRSLNEDGKGKKADLSAIWLAASDISKILKHGDTVILESTSSVGTTKKLAKKLESLSGLVAGKDFFIGYSPERAIPGKTFFEIVNNNRVIGGVDESSTQKIVQLYSAFVKGEITLTDSKAAEMVKLVENSSRDVQIAFANQVAAMAYEAEIDPYKLIDIANKHPRVNILSPRCGVGGHCIAVDPWFLVESFPKQTQLLQAARKINDAKPYQVIEMVKNSIKNLNLNRKCNLLVLGLTFKPDVDDLRESPALQIAQELVKQEGINLSISDPNIEKENLPDSLKPYFVNFKVEIDKSDLILLLVGHKEFKNPDLFLNKNVLDFSGLNIDTAFINQKLREVIVNF